MMLNLNNVKLGNKMLLLLMIPILALMATSAVSVLEIKGQSSDLIDNLYNETHQSFYWILNADRDYYQALEAQMLMEQTADAEKLKGLRDAYYENAKQTVDRVHAAFEIISKNRASFEPYKHPDSNLNMFELFSEFDKDYARWYGIFDPESNTMKDKAGYISAFDSARDRMNQMEEILDVYGNDIIAHSSKSVQKTQSYIIAAALAAILLSLTLGTLIIRNINKRTQKVIQLINKTADFDLAYDNSFDSYLKEKDEFGIIIHAESGAREEFKRIICEVIQETANVKNAIAAANMNMSQLGEQIEEISATTEELSAGMQETAASTQEMNATSIEIERTAGNISEKAQEGSQTADEIKNRAGLLRTNFFNSQESALKVFDEVKVKLQRALEESKAVEQINALADAILQITSQTNLLALNAAIEAARAGDAGRGFAVVADEIRKLAEDSKKMATEIQDITKVVTNSVSNLSANSYNLLSFMEENVGRDYKNMLHATDQYKMDAEYVDGLVRDFSHTSKELLSAIHSIINAINEVTNATAEGASGTSTIAEKSTVVVSRASDVIKKISSTQEGAEKLNGMVSKFVV